MASPQSHIAMVAFPYGSHSASLFSLTTHLGSLSSSSSSHFSFLTTSRSLASLPRPCLPNISFVPISDAITDPSVPANIEDQIGMFLRSFQESLRKGLKEAEVEVGSKVSCVISDAFLWMAGDVASEIGVKWVPVWTGGPQALSAHLHTDLIRKIVGVGDEAMKSYGDKKMKFVPGLSNHLAIDLPHGIIVGDLNSPFSTMLYQMVHRLLNSDTIMLNMIQGLDPTVESYFTQKFTNYLPVGPFHLLNSSEMEQATDPYGCISWLDQYEGEQATVAYISLGTVVTISPSELTSLANGLEASGASFIWSLKENNAQSLLPSGFIDRMTETGKGKIVPWAPQNSVLGHKAVGVFVSHCGWNSVMESIAAGVPILCRPFFADQLVNAKAIWQVWNFGIVLDGGTFTEEGVVKALQVVLKGEEGRKMRDKARQLKQMANNALTQHGTSRNNLNRFIKIKLKPSMLMLLRHSPSTLLEIDTAISIRDPDMTEAMISIARSQKRNLVDCLA